MATTDDDAVLWLLKRRGRSRGAEEEDVGRKRRPLWSSDEVERSIARGD